MNKQFITGLMVGSFVLGCPGILSAALVEPGLIAEYSQGAAPVSNGAAGGFLPAQSAGSVRGGITEEILNNLSYEMIPGSSLPNYSNESVITLRNGKFSRSAPNCETEKIARHVFGDLTGRGTKDAAVLILATTCGSDLSYSLYGVTTENGRPQVTSVPEVLGNVQIDSLEITKPGQISVSLLAPKNKDTNAPPSLKTTLVFKFENGGLSLTETENKDYLPLQHGVYVYKDVPCKDAPTASVLSYWGGLFSSPHEIGKITQATHNGNIYDLKLTCIGGGGVGGEGVYACEDAKIEVKDRKTFTTLGQHSGTYRYCGPRLF